jgi:hypothetical protein
MKDGLGLRHDVQDAQLMDRHCEHIGRCDALMLELREHRPPRVATILIGGPARNERVGRWMIALRRLFPGRTDASHGGVSRIPFAAVRAIGNTIELDVLRDELPSEHVEQWLARNVIRRVPGAEHKKESKS